MLYIHELRHLNPKMADLESVYLIRELKQKTPYPLVLNDVHTLCTEFFVSPTDVEAIQEAQRLLPEVAQQLHTIVKERNSIHEQINGERALKLVQELQQPLYQSSRYLEDMASWQLSCLEQMIQILNTLPKLKTKEQKAQYNEQLKKIFRRLLRNEDFMLKHHDIIHEGSVHAISGLDEGMGKGFLIHITLEEELKKLSYAVIKGRLPPEELQRIEQLREQVAVLKRGIDRAYQSQMRMVNYAVIWYAYVKWMMSSL